MFLKRPKINNTGIYITVISLALKYHINRITGRLILCPAFYSLSICCHPVQPICVPMVLMSERNISIWIVNIQLSDSLYCHSVPNTVNIFTLERPNSHEDTNIMTKYIFINNVLWSYGPNLSIIGVNSGNIVKHVSKVGQPFLDEKKVWN